MPSTLLLLVATLSPALAWLPMGEWRSGNVTASGDGAPCVCRVFLPDCTFPADRVQRTQQVSTDLAREVELQGDKLVHYGGRLGIFLGELMDLTVRVAMLDTTPNSYIKLDFELLRVELGEFEALVAQLRDSLNVSSAIIDRLYIEVQNMTVLVNQMETLDKSNLEVIHIEFIKLQRKLEEWQKDSDLYKPNIGNCNHTGTLSVSKPRQIQINAHLKPGYQYGGWGKDSKPVQGFESMYWYGASSSPSVWDFYLYSDYDKLMQRSSFTHHSLPQGYQSIGNNYIVHGNAVYYQAANPFRMSKLNLTSSVYSHSKMTKASEKYTYTYSSNQYLDFSADEKGLWVMYATEEAKGKIVVAKINEKSFNIETEWTTGAFKPQAGNAFMVCGVMYATRPGDLSTEEIYYSYDTKTREEKFMSVPLQKFQEKFVNLHYNPTDQRLYMYNNGYYVSYNVRFNKE